MSNIQLRVKQVIRETKDAVTLVFHKPSDIRTYKPGQFLTFLLNVNGENLRRSYSLSSSPDTDTDLAVTVKVVLNGKASNYLCSSVKPGDFLDVQAPAGVFTLEKAQSDQLILVGAGSGITPLMGILKTALASKKFKKIVLVFGNRDEDHIIFFQELDALASYHDSLFDLHHVLSQPKGSVAHSHTGRISKSVLIKMLEESKGLDIKNADIFTCGPEGMMQEVFKAAEILGINSERIHKESFVSVVDHSGAQTASVADTPAAAVSSEVVTVIYQGSEYKVNMKGKKSILISALDQGIDLPFSCQSGLCTACMGKCTSGKVKMDNPDGLAKKEIEQGYVLTCVGFPVTPNVVIEIE